MSNDIETTTDDHTPETGETKPRSKSGLLFAIGMIAALVLLVALNMG
jgi:hypothetical protein